MRHTVCLWTAQACIDLPMEQTFEALLSSSRWSIQLIFTIWIDEELLHPNIVFRSKVLVMPLWVLFVLDIDGQALCSSEMVHQSHHCHDSIRLTSYFLMYVYMKQHNCIFIDAITNGYFDAETTEFKMSYQCRWMIYMFLN